MTHPTFKYVGNKIFDPSGLIRVGECDGSVDAFRIVVLVQSAVPVILAPNGTVAADGTLTLGTALPANYANAWVYLPAGAVVGGAAGLYLVQFTSTTVGSVKTNFVNPAGAFNPNVPNGPFVAAVGSGSAYTQVTNTDVNLANVTIPGGLMGGNGAVRTTVQSSNNNSAGNKIVTYKYAGATGVAGTLTATTGARSQFQTSNRGNQALNVSYASFSAPFGTTSNPIPYTAVNTAVDQSLAVTGQIATATDYIVFESLMVEVLPG